MRTFVSKVGRLILVIFAVTFLTQLLGSFVPGSLDQILAPFATPVQRATIRADLHLDQNVVVRYGYWARDFVRGDLGRRYQSGGSQPVWPEIKRALPISLELMFWSQFVALALAIPLGVLTAYRAGRWSDKVTTSVSFGLLALPSFALALLLAYYLGARAGILPAVGYEPWGSGPWEHLRTIIIPVVALAAGQLAVYQRLLRSDLLATLQQDFIAVAKAKGLKPSRILWRHALRPSSLTLLTVAGLQTGALIGGTIVVEVIFGIPGMGSLIQYAVTTRQYAELQSEVAVVAIVFVLVNFLVDYLYTVLDPQDPHMSLPEETIAPGVAAAGPAPIALVDAKRKGIGIMAWLAIAWMALMLFFAIFGPMLGLDASSNLALKRQPPGYDGHILGGDQSGRDMLTIIILGTRASMVIAFGSIAFGVLVGGFLGLVAGFFKGRIPGILGGLFDILLAYPPVVLALFLVSVMASGPATSPAARQTAIILSIGIVAVPLLARITRANTLSWSEREFVTAARAMGASTWRILFRDVLPNVVPAMASIALLSVAIAIVAESALSILGVGPIGDSWGNILNQGRDELSRAPHIVFSVVLFLFLTVMSLNYLGDVIRRRFDVREAAI